MGFVPIRLDQYVQRHLESNPDVHEADLRRRLRFALDAARRGERCGYGNPIWVIGSAEAGLGCFSCITGEAVPNSDYEIAEACCLK